MVVSRISRLESNIEEEDLSVGPDNPLEGLRELRGLPEHCSERVPELQGYFTHKKPRPPRTLPHDYAQGPMVALGQGAVSYEQTSASRPTIRSRACASCEDSLSIAERACRVSGAVICIRTSHLRVERYPSESGVLFF